MSAHSTLRPVVAVIGTTGVGKSQLAVSLARSIPAHVPSLGSAAETLASAIILSADSMQLYKGLDVITNKVTKDEQGGIEHWGLDIVQPGESGSWDVGKWCNEAGQKIVSLPKTTLPIICGGTHYFIQHFLFPPSELSTTRPRTPPTGPGQSFDPLAVRWKPTTSRPAVPDSLDPQLLILLDTFWTAEPIWPESDQHEENDIAGPSKKATRPVPSESAQQLALYRLLSAVDAKEAGRWHWRDARKVRRALERWWEGGGGTAQAAVADGNGESEGEHRSGRRARFRTLIFWVYEPLEALRPRLSRRVDKMVDNGLLREIAEMRGTAQSIYGSSDEVDHTEGVFQSIGYKEFAGLPLPQADPSLDPRFQQMLEDTKLRTHQYAKSQLKWIQKQLLPVVREAKALGGDVEVFVVSGGVNGEDCAKGILRAFLDDKPLPNRTETGHPDAARLLGIMAQPERDSRVPDTAERQAIHLRRDCSVCSTPDQPYSIAVREWGAHIQSRTHKSHVKIATGFHAKVKEAQLAQQSQKRAEREILRMGKTARTSDDGQG